MGGDHEKGEGERPKKDSKGEQKGLKKETWLVRIKERPKTREGWWLESAKMNAKEEQEGEKGQTRDVNREVSLMLGEEG